MKSIPDKTELTAAERRHYWRMHWLNSLQAFADETGQRSKWVNPDEMNPHYSFVECMCCYFDDANLADKFSYIKLIDNGYITREEANAVEDFHQLADKYYSPSEDDYDNQAVLDDPAWHKVVEAAQQAQVRLGLILTCAHELAALTKPSVWMKVGSVFHGSYPAPKPDSPIAFGSG